VRKFTIFTLIGIVVIFLFSAVAFGGEGGITYKIYSEGDHKAIEVKTALADYVFSEAGGTLRSVYLYFAPYGSKPADLVPGTKTTYKDGNYTRQYLANTIYPFTVQSGGETVATHFTLTAPPSAPRPDELAIEFTGTVGNLRMTKRFLLRNDPYYTVGVTIKVENPSGEAVPLRIVLGDATSAVSKELVYQFDSGVSTAPLAPGSYTSFDGLGLMNKATVFFLKTPGGSEITPFATLLGDRTAFGITVSAAPGESTYSFSLYGGRRRYLLMDAVGLGSLDNPGTGARLIIPVVQFLKLLYRYTGNYGWAIILFTLVTRLVLFPLMRKQYHSMAKMQKLQPKLQEIQKRFKDDRELLQQKMMELYKREGVNPMGGCLPMVIQLPILILLWKAILYASEEIHLSPGFLWIPDLSLRDPLFILVILTTGAMILQQRLMTPMTSDQSSGSQKYMGYIFPLFMAFFFWNFPAGLWLYYLLTTLSQIGQQAFVNWEMGKAEAAVGGAAPPGSSVEPGGKEAQDGDDKGGD